MTAYRFELRRDTAANWTAANTILLAGEPAIETDTGRLKLGDGATPWAALPYATSGTADVMTPARAYALTLALGS